MNAAVEAYQRTLRRLTIADDRFVKRVLAGYDEPALLDSKATALVRLASLIALDAAPPSYMCQVESLRRNGATNDEIVDCLLAVMPVVGPGRVVSAAPKLGLALGYDVSEALE